MSVQFDKIEAPNWDLSYIKDYPVDDSGEGFIHQPSTFAMYWAMTATHMSRLFTREDMKEFLFRLAITLDCLKLMENWFQYDRILNYSHNEMVYTLSETDILFHFGFEAGDGYRNFWPREKYLGDIEKGIFNAKFIGSLMGCQIIPLRQTGEDTYALNDQEFTAELTDQLLKNAAFFAEDIIKHAPEHLFEYSNEAKEKKMKELEMRRQRIASIPGFSLDMIPPDIIEECMEIMLHPDYIEELKNPENTEKWQFECRRLIHLAWLWANDLFIIDEGEAWEVEGVSLKHEDYMDEDGTYHILGTIEAYGMDETVDLLKGIGF